MDGANLNALVGVARPGKFGPDVAHVRCTNLFHPPWWGWSGRWADWCRRAFSTSLAGTRVDQEERRGDGGAWGALVFCLYLWAYIALMGCQGLKKATDAILSQLHSEKTGASPVYAGPDGFVARECIMMCAT